MPLFLATLTAAVGSILVVFSDGYAVIEKLATVGTPFGVIVAVVSV